MASLKKILNNSLARLSIVIIIAILIFLLIQTFSGNKNLTTINNSTYCKVSGKNSGVISVKSYITYATTYDIWVHFESPVQLNYDETSDIYITHCC
jgi:hypothetical protein